MEIKLSVSIGATLQVKNAKGEWDWIKPEIGCEVSLDPTSFPKLEGEDEQYLTPSRLQDVFSEMWDGVVGPQFKSVVNELINDQAPKEEAIDPADEAVEKVFPVEYVSEDLDETDVIIKSNDDFEVEYVEEEDAYY